jgi:hypothetical protein
MQSLTAKVSVAACLVAAACSAMGAAAPRVEAVQVDASRPDWENPAVNARGKLPAAATHFAFESREAALAADPTRSTRYAGRSVVVQLLAFVRRRAERLRETGLRRFTLEDHQGSGHVAGRRL